jgi:hypothetical protein
MNLADRLAAVLYLGGGLLDRWVKMVAKLGALDGANNDPKKKLSCLEDPRWSKPVAAFTKKFPEFMPELEKVALLVRETATNSCVVGAWLSRNGTQSTRASRRTRRLVRGVH